MSLPWHVLNKAVVACRKSCRRRNVDRPVFFKRFAERWRALRPVILDDITCCLHLTSLFSNSSQDTLRSTVLRTSNVFSWKWKHYQSAWSSSQLNVFGHKSHSCIPVWTIYPRFGRSQWFKHVQSLEHGAISITLDLLDSWGCPGLQGWANFFWCCCSSSFWSMLVLCLGTHRKVVSATKQTSFFPVTLDSWKLKSLTIDCCSRSTCFSQYHRWLHFYTWRTDEEHLHKEVESWSKAACHTHISLITEQADMSSHSTCSMAEAGPQNEKRDTQAKGRQSLDECNHGLLVIEPFWDSEIDGFGHDVLFWVRPETCHHVPIHASISQGKYLLQVAIIYYLCWQVLATGHQINTDMVIWAWFL